VRHIGVMNMMRLAFLLCTLPALAQAETLLPPVASACISSPFGPRKLPNRPWAGTYHYGIDMPAPAGAAIRAVAPGRVIRAQRKGVGGLEVLVQHDGFIGVYSHLGMMTPALAMGKTNLAAGDKIGVVGHSGLTYGMHVYFEMLRDGKPVDPAPYLGITECGGAHIKSPATTDASAAMPASLSSPSQRSPHSLRSHSLIPPSR
jgi:hypothetical protein